MRDGVQLATDIYWPDGQQLAGCPPRPVLLERSPYDVLAMRPSDGLHASGAAVTPESGAAFFVERGYVVVRQDVRGQGGSGGVFSKYVNEADDGFDTHEWIAAQPWCDGRIITHGVSYSAHTQAAAASVGAGHVAAMIMDSGGFSSAFDAGGRFGGAFELKQAVWSLRKALGPDAPDKLEAWFSVLPWRRGFSPLAEVPDYESFLFDQWNHEDLDDYWTQPGLYARGYYDKFPAVPVLTIGSWYDPYVFTAVENFRMLRKRNAASALVMGSWTHGARSVSWAGDVDFGPAAPLDGNLAPDYLQFKDSWLRSVLAGDGDVAVRYFLMGGGSGRRLSSGRMDHGGHWSAAEDWPPPQVQSTRLYLHADQSLRGEPPVDSEAISYDFDPRDPVPSRGGGITSGEPLMSGGAFDQVETRSGVLMPLSARRDVVSFQTEPLARPVVVTGRVAVHLRFSSSAPDTDVAVKLVDVHPPNADYPHGFAMNVTDGMLRCRHRDDPAHPTLMEPGQEYRLVVPIPDTANLFEIGHRIRLDITSSNFPRCDVNPNTGGPVVASRTFVIARNTIHIGGTFLELDVLPDVA